MDLEISTSKPAALHADYGANEGYKAPMLPPAPSILLKKENEPWRGPSAFGMANILNRSNMAPQPPPQALPKFSLPSLHSFGKPLMTKQDPTMSRVRSILNDSPSAPTEPVKSSESSPLTTSQPVEMTESPRKVAPSRRIAPAPTEDDDNGDDENGADSIRGGRWSSEEHERFLAGFRIHGHKWKRVQQVVRTRSVTQVRTHAQKYLLKLAKLKGEKKPGGDAGNNNNNTSDTESSQPQSASQDDGDDRSPRKKARRYDSPQPVDEVYITAAATTLCFLMRQKIDSLFDGRIDEEKDVEPLDCYSSQQAYGGDDHSIENSRKRPFVHLMNDESNKYSYTERSTSSAESGGYSIDGKQLCS